MKNIGLFCASSNNLDAIYYENANMFGKWLADNNNTLIYGGSNCGLMEATAKSVYENNGKTIGIVPQILIDKNYVSKYLSSVIPCKNLSDRKEKLIKKSDIIVVMPGSIGTLDEAFTVMSAHSIGLNKKKVIFWNINGFWDELFVLFESLKNKGVGNISDKLYSVANTFEELTELLKDK